MYVIKGLRNFKGHEGEHCAQGTLYKGSTKVANWSDDSHGGPMHIDFVSKDASDEFVAFGRTALVGKLDVLGKPHKPETMTEWAVIENMMLDMSIAAQEDLQHRKLVKNHIVYFLRDEKSSDGKTLYTWKAPYTEKNVTALREEHGEALLEIINKRFDMPFENEEQADLKAHNAWLKKQCKANTLFVIRDEKSGENVTMRTKHPYSEQIAAQVRAKYPKNLVEIVNERYL